jgi:hypothetical protein
MSRSSATSLVLLDASTGVGPSLRPDGCLRNTRERRTLKSVAAALTILGALMVISGAYELGPDARDPSSGTPHRRFSGPAQSAQHPSSFDRSHLRGHTELAPDGSHPVRLGCSSADDRRRALPTALLEPGLPRRPQLAGCGPLGDPRWVGCTLDGCNTDRSPIGVASGARDLAFRGGTTRSNAHSALRRSTSTVSGVDTRRRLSLERSSASRPRLPVRS